MSRSKRNYDHLIDYFGNYKGLGGGGGGSALNFVGSVPNVGSLPPTYPGEPGDAYYIDDGSDQYYAWDGATWNNVGTALKGQKGIDGAKGDIGLKGAAGSGGGTGTKGDVGPKGEIGTKGAAGEKGAQNDKGQKGASGGASAKGDVGPKGEIGSKGELGSKGDLGVGDKGDIGAKGELGSKGEVGDKGEIGQKGATGIQGIQGDKGLKGELNDKGAKGDDGTAAALLTYQGSVPNVPSLPVGATAGDTYFVADGSRLYYSWDGAAWVSSGQAVKGDIGVQGVKGATGATGTDGNDGAVGAKGEAGNKGQQGDVGQKGEQNAKGAIGATGAKGTAGAKGDLGEKGADGTAAALLSYQGAVADQTALNAINTTGFVGGETYFVDDANQEYYSWDAGSSSWFSSGQAVKGDVGNKGATGPKGEIGEKGETADKGDKGVKGNFIKGDKGEVGVKGEVGPKGEKGEVADKGDKGETADKGEKGETADKGDKGDKGTKGVEADKGQQGFRGVKGDLIAGAVTAHATFNGASSTGTGGTFPPGDVYSSHEITSIERLGTGNYRLFFASPFKRALTQAEIDAGQYTNTLGVVVPITVPAPLTPLPDPLYTWQTEFWVPDGNSYSVVATCGGTDFTAASRNVNIMVYEAEYVDILVERGDSGANVDVPFVSIACYGTGTPGYLISAKGEPGTGAGDKGDKGMKGEEGEKGVLGDKGLIPAGAASAHANFDGSSGAAFDFATDTRAYYNVSDITRSNVGTFTIIWDTAFASDAYTVVPIAGGKFDHTGTGRAVSVSVIDQTSTYVTIVAERANGDNIDDSNIALVAYGNGDSGIYSTIKGDKGQQGPASLAAGTTTTVEYPNNATVTNVGTLDSQVFDFEIPRGEKGDRQFQAAGAVTCHATFVATAALATGVLAASDIKSSFGISQIEKIRDGEFTVTFTNPFTGADNYSAVGTAHGDYGATIGGSTRVVLFNTFTASSVLCEIEESSGDRGSADTVSVVFYGDQSMGDLLEIKGEKGSIGPSGGEKGQKGDDSTVIGPKGEVGQKGVEGEKGTDGTAVEKGDPGVDGEKGAPGAGAGIEISYVAFDGSAGSGFSWGSDKIAEFNIQTVTRLGPGQYEIFWDTNYSSANYAIWCYTYTSGDSLIGSVNLISRGAGSVIVETKNMNGTVEDSNEYICVQAMGA